MQPEIHPFHPVRPTAMLVGLGLVVVIAASSSGCSTIFDTPSLEGVRSAVSEKVMNDLAEIAYEEAKALAAKPVQAVADKATEVVSGGMDAAGRAGDEAVGAVASSAGAAAGTSAGGDAASGASAHDVGRRVPDWEVSWVGGERAQLLMQGVFDAPVSLNGEVLASAGQLGRRLMVLEPGRHQLRIDYPSGAPFTVDVQLDAGERITLQGAK